MTLKTRFKKQVFIRLSSDQTGLVCTAKWWFLSRVTRISFPGNAPCSVPQATKETALGDQAVPMRPTPSMAMRTIPDGVTAKDAGTRQLKDVIFNTYPRPIESAMEGDRLPASAETCEQCHDREKFIGSRLRILTEFNSDELNTRTDTVLMMMVGGGKYGGIHGVHLGPGVHIRYAASDKKRQTIPWVEYRVAGSSVDRTYLVSGANPASIRNLPMFDMQCVDCHNRTAHTFELPARAVDGALTAGRISTSLPFIKKTGVELIKAVYRTSEEAERDISDGLTAFYERMYPDVYSKRTGDIQAAGRDLLTVYNQNVFPDLKVTWGTYPNNLGHTDFPGCFRCHDGAHATADKTTIPQDCTVCHRMLAVQEASPEILKTLGVADR